MVILRFIAVVLCSVHVFAASPALEAIAETNSKFSRDFFKTLHEKQGNLVVSPLSAHLVLSMTQLGARGSTASEMSTGLHLPADTTLSSQGLRQLTDTLQGENSDGIKLKIANRIYLSTGFSVRQDFLSAARNTFHSDVQSVHFGNPKTRDFINNWVEEVTENKVKNLIPEGKLGPSTSVVLINAAYFYGKWASEFNAVNTNHRTFHTSQTESVQVPMMSITRTFPYAVLDTLDAKLVELPYEGNTMSFVVILPNSRDGLSDLEKKMQTADLSALVKSARNSLMALSLPKFKIETSLDLKDPLIKMGMGIIYSSTSDFYGMSTSESIKVSEVAQKTIIEVAEAGTEAASATYVIMSRSGRLQPPLSFNVNHPFLFYLIHKTTNSNHVVMFNGRVVEPQGFSE